MVDSITQANVAVSNSRSNNDNKAVLQPRKPQMAPSGDVVVLSKNTKKSKNSQQKQKTPMTTSQKVALGVGVVSAGAGVLIAAVFLKTSGILRPKKDILADLDFDILPSHVKDKLTDEVNKLKTSLVDITGSKSYIEEVKKMKKCFQPPKVEVVDVDKAKTILDKKIIGLDEVKSQVIDYLKVRNYHIKNGTNDLNKFILCLDGPPGVGKTSIAEAIAEAIGVPFERIGLSGVDKATQIVGGERIWQGAAPGKIIKAVQHSQCSNPVILLDEMDKLGHNIQHGDPGEALLDVLEPKQCKHFTDNYLEFPFDLSNVNFIITSNNLNKISSTLKDRVHIIKIPPYTHALKLDICKLELVNKMNATKLDPSKVEFTQSAIDRMVERGLDDDGKVSAGARKALGNLTQVFNKVLIATDENPSQSKFVIDSKFVDDVLDKYNPAKASGAAATSDNLGRSHSAKPRKGFFAKFFGKN